jgi:hypothetical protein
MQSSQRPGLLPVPFADTGTKNDIPVNPSSTPGLASYKLGFPPVTMTPISAGGVPPAGPDFNGVFNSITQAIRWNQAGGMYPYDASFATTVTGYPVGARVLSSDGAFTWVNSIENNAADPETTNTGWLPEPSPGAAQVSGLSSSSVTLTTLQAARSRIVLSGALTANINLVFPAWVKFWNVINNCTGSFSVICKTSSGTGVPVGAGKNISIAGDGTNIVFSSLQSANALKEIADSSLQATARTNLGLGTASTRNIGAALGTNQVPDMSFFGVNLTGGTSFRFPNGMIVQTGTALTSASGPVVVNLQTTYPNSFNVFVSSQEVGVITSAAAAVVNSSQFRLSFYSAGSPAASNVAFYTIGY